MGLVRGVTGGGGGNGGKLKDYPPGVGKDLKGRANQSGSAGHHPAATRKDEDGDGSADLPLQDFYRGILTCSGRSICYRGIAARRAGLFHRQRRFAEAAPRSLPWPFVYQFAGAPEVD